MWKIPYTGKYNTLENMIRKICVVKKFDFYYFFIFLF